MEWNEEIIRDYLNGRLIGIEKTDFESEMDKNVQLKQAVDWHKSLIAALKEEKEKSFFREIVQEAWQESPESEGEIPSGSITTPLWKRTWSMVAAVLVIAMGFVVLYMASDNSEKLYNQYHTPYTATNIIDADPRISDEGSENLVGRINSMIQAYREHQYNRAIALGDSILEKTQPKVVYFYRGLSYLETNRLKEANDDLEEATVSKVYGAEALWYQSLSYLKKGDKATAKQKLSLLLARYPDYSDKDKIHQLISFL